MRRNIYKIIRFLLKLLNNRLNKYRFISPSILCRFENFSAILTKSKTRFKYKKSENLFIADDSKLKRYFFNKERGFKVYRRGIENRGKFIFRSYCMQNISFKDEDIIIDCGANLGDLAIELEKLPQKLKYIGLEPAPQDFASLKRNIKLNDAIILKKALGKEENIHKLYVNSEKADSSLLEIKNFSDILDVEVVRLDNLCKELNIKKIKFLKIEAEGYEPEILIGAKGILRNIEYIAIDGGYERGIECTQTFTTVTNFLLANNFELVDIYFKWHRALFKKLS